MLKWKDFSIGGYNFDDWSEVKELYTPTDVSSSTDRSLHVRGREALEHHLQHYTIPWGKVFIAFAVSNVQMTTTATMGLFGTGKAFGRYPVSHQQIGWGDNPGAPIAWSPTEYLHYQDPTPKWYYYNGSTWGTLVLHNGIVWECCQTHWPNPSYEPGTEGGTHWTEGSIWDVDWVVAKDYFFNELEMVDVEGVSGAYMCMVDHTSHADNKPCSGVDWDYGSGGIWNAGDEFYPDLSSQYGFSEKCLNVSEGTKNPFSSGIIAIFERFAENRLRRIDAKTDTGTMKAGAILYGIEVNV